MEAVLPTQRTQPKHLKALVSCVKIELFSLIFLSQDISIPAFSANDCKF